MRGATSLTRSIRKDVVLVGGGHAHVAVLRSFAMRPMEGVRVILITRETHAPYSGMLPGSVAGHYEKDECHVDLAPLARFANAELIHAEVDGIELERKKILLNGRPPIRYDLLSINVGIRPKMTLEDGVSRYVTPVKPIDGFWERWERLVSEYLASDQPTHIVVVGGGAGGVELVLAMQHRLDKERNTSERDVPPASFSLCTRGRIIQSHPQARGFFVQELSRRGITLYENTKVVRAASNNLTTESGEEIICTHCVWCTDGSAPSWLKENTGLMTDESGFVLIKPTLQTVTDDSVFAVGDCASCKEYERPKAGVFAVRQGPPLAENIRLHLEGKRPRTFKPQSKYLSIISAGNQYAVAVYGKWLIVKGKWVWKWKNALDVGWMQKYGEDVIRQLDKTHSQVRSDRVTTEINPLGASMPSDMRCAGCGAKVGPLVLKKVLNRLHHNIVKRSEVVMGIDRAEDAAAIAYSPGFLSIHTVDFFRSFLGDIYTFGRIATLHALSDLFAMGAQPVSAMALATVPVANDDVTEEMLFQLLSGACEELKKSNCALVGGHTCEGQEVSLGFSVSGMCQKKELLCKAGANPGDVLILTKPLGTGVVFAADMRGKAKARWLDEAVKYMLQSNEMAAGIFKNKGATSCTDVTGFGLLGHLMEILDASDVNAELHLNDVPLLEGAIGCAEMGIYSSLYPKNLQLCDSVSNLPEASLLLQWPLIFDPQTSGGLLASVPQEKSSAVLEELHLAGCEKASIIGFVKNSTGRGKRVRVI